MTFAQGRNRLTTHFSERIPVVKRHISLQSQCGDIDTHTDSDKWVDALAHLPRVTPLVPVSLTAHRAWSVSGQK